MTTMVQARTGALPFNMCEGDTVSGTLNRPTAPRPHPMDTRRALWPLPQCPPTSS